MINLHSTIVTPTLTLSTSAYSAGQNVGGLITLLNALRPSGLTGELQSLQVLDAANQNASLNILLFDTQPVGTYFDRTTFEVNSADVPHVVANLVVSASTYATVGGITSSSSSSSASGTSLLGGVGIATLANIGQRLLTTSKAGTLWALMGTESAPLYPAGALTLRFGIKQD